MKQKWRQKTAQETVRLSVATNKEAIKKEYYQFKYKILVTYSEIRVFKFN